MRSPIGSIGLACRPRQIFDAECLEEGMVFEIRSLLAVNSTQIQFDPIASTGNTYQHASIILGDSKEVTSNRLKLIII